MPGMRKLPLDRAKYTAFCEALSTLLERDPEMGDSAALRQCLRDNKQSLGERTAREVRAAADQALRALVCCMVLGTTSLAAFHDRCRTWLKAQGLPLPPWDPGTSRTANRLVASQFPQWIQRPPRANESAKKCQ
jgi:hypothetical protein